MSEVVYPPDYGRWIIFKKFPDTWLMGYFKTWGAGSVRNMAIVELEDGELCSTLQIYNKEAYFIRNGSWSPLAKFLWWVTSKPESRKYYLALDY